MLKPKPENVAKGKWWDHCWTLVEGCTSVSEGCDHCWSEAMARRFKRDWTPRFRADRLDIPLRTRKPAVWAVWNDLFHDAVTDSEILTAINTMWKCYHDGKDHLFMVLTKRPERAAALLRNAKRIAHVHGVPIDQEMGPQDAVPPNIALGVTVESQAHVARVGDLLRAWPGKTFVSIEPMLGPVNLGEYFRCNHCGLYTDAECPGSSGSCVSPNYLDLVICGGESGPGARPMHPEWARGLRDQCAEAGVPFWFKQWGEWAPCQDERILDGAVFRVGKKAAGRLLDGVEHNGWFID